MGVADVASIWVEQGQLGRIYGFGDDVYMSELVSVIIPVRNRPQMLSEAVGSVVSQTYRPLEIIIVDDGSTDETPAVAERLQAELTVPVIIATQAMSTGPGPARECGRGMAKGEFIQYLDSDDLLLPKKLEMQVDGLRQAPECGVSYGKTAFSKVGEPYKKIAWKRTGERIEWMFPSFIMDRWWGTSTPLYRRSVCDAAGPWKAISNEQDWEYDCRVAALGVRLHYCDEFVSRERAHEGLRQCQGGASDPLKLAGRAQARQQIWQSVLAASVPRSSLEVQFFARYTFLLARQCGNAGLTTESRALFELARAASTNRRARGLDFRLYRILASMIGWPSAGKLSCAIDGWLRARSMSPPRLSG